MKTELNINRLKECRERLGISKNEAAKLIGVSQPAYLRYESGVRTPSKQVIKEIATAFNTSVEYLTNLTDTNTSVYITISKDKDALLVDILDKCRDLDLEQQKRLLEYIEKMRK